jgi:tetratricopeptide (TPR) repeat protein
MKWSLEKDSSASYDGWLYISELYQKNGDYGEAIKAMLVAVERCNQPWVVRRLVQLHTDAGDNNGAIDALTNALKAVPTLFVLWTDLADSLTDQGNPKQAIRTLETAVNKYPGCSWLWREFADRCERMDELDGALKVIKMSIERNPVEWWPWRDLGEYLKRTR